MHQGMLFLPHKVYFCFHMLSVFYLIYSCAFQLGKNRWFVGKKCNLRRLRTIGRNPLSIRSHLRQGSQAGQSTNQTGPHFMSQKWSLLAMPLLSQLNGPTRQALLPYFVGQRDERRCRRLYQHRNGEHENGSRQRKKIRVIKDF